MNRRIDGLDLLSFGLVGASAIATAAVYDQLPDPMPTHFDVHGAPDGWMPKAIGAFLLPVLAILVWALVRFGSALLPPSRREKLEASPVSAVGLLVGGLLATMQALLLKAALSTPPHLGAGVWMIAGVFFVLLGLVIPRVRQNPWIGVRTPWSLASEENWARTHRFAGYTMTASGVLAVLASIAGAPVAGLVLILAGALSPVAYSWRISRAARR